METPIGAEPPVNGPDTPILIGSAAWLERERLSSAAATKAWVLYDICLPPGVILSAGPSRCDPTHFLRAPEYFRAPLSTLILSHLAFSKLTKLSGSGGCDQAEAL